MEFSKEWLETVLRRHVRETNVCRICEVSVGPATIKGDNYMSDISRLKMKVLLGNGRQRNLSIITKVIPQSEASNRQMKEFGFFQIEIKVFTEILPAMTFLMEEAEQIEELWPQLLHYRRDDLLIFEDLKAFGYATGNRQIGFNLEEASFIASELGRFHAMSAIVNQKDLIPTAKNLAKSFYFDERAQPFSDFGFTTMANLMKSDWGAEWFPIAEKILTLKGKSWKILQEIFEADCKLPVLNHGDFWVNNIMLKYSPYNNSISSIRFIDFQISFMGSFAYDLLYFFMTSVQADVFLQDREKILTAYQRSLELNFKRFEFEPAYLPTLEDIKKELDRCAFIMLPVMMFDVPLMLSTGEAIPDMEEIMRQFEEGQTFSGTVECFKTPAYTRKAKKILNWYFSNYSV